MRRTVPALLLLLPLAAACTDDSRTPAAPEIAPVLAQSTCEPVPLDPVLIQLIQGMEGEIDRLQAAGRLNAGQSLALRRHLINARRQADRGEYCAARDQLRAFRDQLEELVGAVGLSDRESYDLRHASRLALATRVVQPGDPEEYAPGASGPVRTVPFNGQPLRVQVVDGLAIFNGDMILGFEDELEAGAGDVVGPARTGPCTDCTRWTESIGFGYGDDWGSESVNAEMRERIARAIGHWREKTGYEFHEQPDNPDLLFRNSMGCSSFVGRQGANSPDPHTINIGTGCRYGSVVHEIAHAIGIWHEQARNDRDDFVTVTIDAVREGRTHNFDQFGDAGVDLGAYEVGSIMHYACGDFRAADATVDPIQPLAAGVTCSDLGQRDSLTTRDIAGAYWTDEVLYEIVGATSGDVGNRFDLAFSFETEPVDDRFLRWVVDGIGVLGVGPTFSTGDPGLPNGTHVVRAQVFIGGVLIGDRRLTLTIVNSPPSVDLGPDREVDVNRSFSIFADVVDAEDGSCPPTVCTYEWSPEPRSGSGGVANYFGFTEGTTTITVTVTDGAGASASDAVQISIVDSPPTPIIESPAPGSDFPAGSIVAISGYATDPNTGPGPEDGRLPCYPSVLSFSSSDPSDLIDVPEGTDRCLGTIRFGEAGPRTLTLEANDLKGNVTSTSITVQVYECGASGCPPAASLGLDPPSELDGSLYDPPFTGPGYLIDTELQVTAAISDPDGPPPGTVAYEWRVRPPCFGGCDAFVVGSGSLIVPNNAVLTWTPSADPRVTDWPSCTTTALPFVISLQVTDGNGNTEVYSRTVHLACDLI